MDLKQIFSKNLTRLRKLKGLSQRELAQLTGLTQKIITSYENSPDYIPLDKIQILAEILEIPPYILFSEDNNNKNTNYNIDNIDVRWLKKIEDIKQLPDFDQKEITRHINYLIEKRKNQFMELKNE